MLSATDVRLETATEVLNAIKTIKFAAWEDKFFNRMQTARDKELNVLKQRFILRVFGNVLVIVTPPLVTVVSFGVYTVYFKQPLTAATAFTSLALFGMLRAPLGALLEMTTAVANAYVSCGRVQDFLAKPETLRYEQVSQSSGPDEPVIGFKNATLTHLSQEDATAADKAMIKDPETTDYFKLANVTLDFPLGKLSIIVGPVQSGKTTILNSLLGETTLLSGKVFAPSDHGSKDFAEKDKASGLDDTVAYCPQTAWLLGTTIRQNIIFGSKWNPERYRKVIHACALERDLEILESGDQTIVGSKGSVCLAIESAALGSAPRVSSLTKIMVRYNRSCQVDNNSESGKTAVIYSIA